MTGVATGAATGDIAEPFAGAEADVTGLVALLDGCANPGVTRRALLVSLAGLPPAMARPQHLRLIASALDPLLGLDRARLFRLADGNLVLVWKTEAAAAEQSTDAALRRLFDGLPGTAPDGMFAFLLLPAATSRITAAIAASIGRVAEPTAPAARKLDAAALARLEAALAQADVSHWSRRVPICRWPAGASPALEWEKRTVSIAALAATLCPGHDPEGDSWLFRRLTLTLDRRMLALLCHAGELRQDGDMRPVGAFGLHLNIASILAPDFLRFDDALPASLRGHVTLGLLPADILADPDAFAFARDFAHNRGYRLMLRGITAGWLCVFPPDLAGVDLVQLHATPELLALPALPEHLMADRLVLSQVASPDALDWGRRMGIQLFQGPLVRQR